jgi:hypothetical protein
MFKMSTQLHSNASLFVSIKIETEKKMSQGHVCKPWATVLPPAIGEFVQPGLSEGPELSLSNVLNLFCLLRYCFLL